MVERIQHSPKRFALLVYIACRHNRPALQRDSLLPVFWPESDEAHARNALRQALFVLRETLGRDVVVGTASEIAIEPSRLHCDVWAFRSAVRHERWGEAARVWTGPFLDGFLVHDADPFMDWLDRTGYELRVQATRVWREAARHLKGDPDAALEALRLALTLAPYCEETLRELVAGLVRNQDRGSAAQTYMDFAARMRRDLDVSPTAATTKYVYGFLGRTAAPSSRPRPGDGFASRHASRTGHPTK